ncbi:hypothetical protein TREPR_0809 [Treponema primitia ZAS-2]|uniref:VWFA domain-containing protein n=1 Tax=Treponema primitia (strain ATCC BAA-887 / DSM 12427 / ZAS-2) TaxID=545694 RepID=F5YIT3_TREPZ|nr:hypothetical protein [Treponema primitia]AEF85035.1 hypothetical protein TREPR_0809 [Treponema primitia ZAS-2]
MAKHIDLDYGSGRYSAFSLKEYTTGMTADSNIRIIESSKAGTASVNIETKTIIIPAIDYSKPMTRDRYRITKGYIDHEIAHMLYPDTSYLGIQNNEMLVNMAHLIDDIRIETLYAKSYVGVGEDFQYLNQLFYDEKRAFNRDKLPEKSFPSIMGTIATTYFGIRHSEAHNSEVSDFLEQKVFPMIDRYLAHKHPDTLQTAEQIISAIRDFLDSIKPDEVKGCDISFQMTKHIEQDSTVIPEEENTIKPYHDTIADLSDPRCLYNYVNTERYEHIKRKQAQVISAYRNMFGAFLVSTTHCRTLKTFQGKFNHREVALVAASLNPRIFTSRVTGRQFSYDVSLLMDCSHSMGGFPMGDGYSTKITKAYETLVIFAEALQGLPDINLEILAFTADSSYTPGMAHARFDSCNNQLFVLKSFANLSSGALPYFPSYHFWYGIARNNFDIGAVCLASRRLRQMPPTNRKLLIVLSDGIPASNIARGTHLLKSYIEEVSRIHPVLGIGLENPAISRCYPGGINLNNLDELKDRVFQDIQHFLVSQMKTRSIEHDRFVKMSDFPF